VAGTRVGHGSIFQIQSIQITPYRSVQYHPIHGWIQSMYNSHFVPIPPQYADNDPVLTQSPQQLSPCPPSPPCFYPHVCNFGNQNTVKLNSTQFLCLHLMLSMVALHAKTRSDNVSVVGTMSEKLHLRHKRAHRLRTYTRNRIWYI